MSIYSDKFTIINQFHSIAEIARETGLTRKLVTSIKAGLHSPTGEALKKFNNLYSSTSYRYAREAGAPAHIASELRGASFDRLITRVSQIRDTISYYTISATQAARVRAEGKGERFDANRVYKTLEKSVREGVSRSKEDYTTLFLDRYSGRIKTAEWTT